MVILRIALAVAASTVLVLAVTALVGDLLEEKSYRDKARDS